METYTDRTVPIVLQSWHRNNVAMFWAMFSYVPRVAIRVG